MIKKNDIYVLFFRGNLTSHIDNYLSWLPKDDDKLATRAFTIIGVTDYIRRYHLVQKYRKKNVRIIAAPLLFHNIISFLFFFILALKNDHVIVNVKKQKWRSVNVVKKIFPKKVKTITEIEGNPWAEFEYLKNPKNSYRKGIYDIELTALKHYIDRIHIELAQADHIFVVTDNLKTVLEDFGISSDKITVKPTGYEARKFFVSSNLREATRRKLGLQSDTVVFVYSGNCFYSWQNISKTLKLACDLGNCMAVDYKVLMLIRDQDTSIANYFIELNNIPQDKIIIKSVQHDEMNAYLNASDIGILLREDDDLNRCSAPGKLGEYLACGLKVITTTHIGLYSEALLGTHYAVLIDDIRNISIDDVLDRLSTLDNRENISSWSKECFSNKKFMNNYVNALQRLI